MGRAILIVFLTAAGMIFLCSHWASASTEKEQWQSFVQQYSYLIEDGKYELAEKMLDNRYDDLASYYEEKSVPHLQTFNQLAEDFKQNPQNADALMEFIELSLAENEEADVVERLKEIQVLVENSEADRVSVMEKWTNLSPLLKLNFPKQDVESATTAFLNYGETSTLDSQQTVLNYLDHVVPEETNNKYDAFIWTAIIIGGSILITLVYVSYRKYRAEKEYQQKKQKLNS
ncbi:sporulation protein YpjB [Halobacillus andaensis]|uniref:sporulation protein YpjB n=1 Tax=Halobacillus andaensis TaxID=1176239 RepID=UPI003D70B86F